MKSCIFCEGRATRPDEVQYNGQPEIINNGRWHRPVDRKELGKTCQRYYLDIYVPGQRVVVWDGSRYTGNDKTTPLATCMKVATVVSWYGRTKEHYTDFSLGPYPSLIDVIFDHSPGVIRKGHFADYIQEAVEVTNGTSL